jgi:hypothetical protein
MTASITRQSVSAGFDRLDEVLPGAQRVHVAEHA